MSKIPPSILNKVQETLNTEHTDWSFLHQLDNYGFYDPLKKCYFLFTKYDIENYYKINDIYTVLTQKCAKFIPIDENDTLKNLLNSNEPESFKLGIALLPKKAYIDTGYGWLFKKDEIFMDDLITAIYVKDKSENATSSSKTSRRSKS